MDIRHAMLGLLRDQPMTGYDMKKAMQHSPAIYWSGNNNQIYKALAALESDGCVQGEVLQGASSPNRKVYQLTPSGRAALRQLSLGFPEVPDIRKPFLVQLNFCGDLCRSEMEALLEQYHRGLQGALLTLTEEVCPSQAAPFEAALRHLITENIRKTYEAERDWVDRVRETILPLMPEQARPVQKGTVQTMEYQYVQKNGQDYVSVTAGHITEEKDALTLVSACAEHGTHRVLLPASALSDEFLNLSTRVAGLVLQKFVNYNIRVAAVIAPEDIRGRFREFVTEINRSTVFHVFDSQDAAETWLMN